MVKEVVESKNQSLGQILASSREALGFSIQDIAEKLNLTKAVIIYLESDDYHSGRKDVFYRGYLRSYAKILSLEAEELVDMYSDKVGSNEQAAMPEPKPGKPADTVALGKLQEHKFVKFILTHIKPITMILILSLIFIVGIWWGRKHSTVNLEASISSMNDELVGPASGNTVNNYRSVEISE